MSVGGYQYGVPAPDLSNIVADARAQAAKIIANVGPLGAGYLPPVLDLESVPMTLDKAKLARWAVIWLRTVQAATGRTPILYTYPNFLQNRLRPTKNIKQFPLWQAEHGPGLRGPRQVAGFQTPLFWQFTSNGLIPGAGADRTDLTCSAVAQSCYSRWRELR